MSCPLTISFNVLKIDCALSCNFLSRCNNGLDICVLWSGGYGKWNLCTSWCFLQQGRLWQWSWLSHEFTSNKDLSQVIYLSTNDCIPSLLLIPYIGASFIHKSPWSCSLPLTRNFVAKKILVLVQIMYLLIVITYESISFYGHTIMHKLLNLP